MYSSKLEPQMKEGYFGSSPEKQLIGRRNFYDIMRKAAKVANEYPIGKLNQLHPELIYQQNKKYGHLFEMAVVIEENGIKKQFLGKGPTVNSAKRNAAQNALSQITGQNECSKTKDENENVDDSTQPFAKKNAAKNTLFQSEKNQKTELDITTKNNDQNYQKSEDCPIKRLQFSHPEITFKEEKRFGPFYSIIAVVSINGEKMFINGKGVSVCTAKRIAALNALALIASQNPENTSNSPETTSVQNLQNKKPPFLQRNALPYKVLPKSNKQPSSSQEILKNRIQSSTNSVEHEVEAIGTYLDEMDYQHPIPILEKLHSELRFEDRPKKGNLFRMIAIIMSKIGIEMHFEGFGESRKLAKWDAARKTLSVIKATDGIEEPYPISKLTKSHPELTFELQPTMGQSFTVKTFINVDGKRTEYKGTGPTKKIAKENASIEALADLELRRGQNKCYSVKYKIITESFEDPSESNSDTESCSNSIADDAYENTWTVQDDPSQTGNDLESFKKKKKVQGLIIGNKNPISILNELKPSLIYNIKEQGGPAHAPIFKVSVILNGREYEGVGRSKKLAKSKAAENALKSFVQFPKADEFNGFQADTKTDFSSEMKGRTVYEEKSIQMAPSKGATMLMNELYPNAKYMFEENSKEASNRFKAAIHLNGEEFVGTGSNKKRAKNAAAMVALTKLLAENPNYANMIQPLRKSTASLEQQVFADRVGRLVNEKFRDLMRCDAVHLKRKVLAGIVMTRDEAMNDMTVICVTTGSKCINGENISASGIALNDMHAEIISRRCLVNFFYDQLRLQFTKGEEHNSIFEPRCDNRGFRVRDNIKFHLYISTAPCGDARIFSPNDAESVDRHSARTSRGRLRTKIESGEGTIPIKGDNIQTWDGILQGERLLTMSCSDKIARWNVLGLQGSLLSCFVDPIYLSSIVLGSLLNESHMQRAIFGRLENTLQGLPPPYHLNRPYMCPTASAEARVARRAPNFSVNWVIGYEKPEIINTVTGKPEGGISRLCKRNFSKRFLDVCRRVTSMGNVDIPIPKIYADAKLAASTYNQAKEQLFRAFSKANSGSWMKKPLEQDQFQIEDDIF